MYCPPLRDMNKKFVADVICGKKFLLKQSRVKRIANPPNFKEFSVKNIWFSVKAHPKKDEILKYFLPFRERRFPTNSI